MSDITKTIRDLVADPTVAGIRIDTDYDAVGATVTPPAGTLVREKTVDDVVGIFTLADGTPAVVLDSWGSQARRWSLALREHADELRLPVIELRHPELTTDSWQWSHRHVDATARIAAKEIQDAGIDYDTLRAASIEHADALLKYSPQSIVCGWWNSHTGKAITQAVAAAPKLGLDKKVFDTPDSKGALGAKSARSMTSEVVAYGVAPRRRYAARIDSAFGPIQAKDVKDAKYSTLGFGSIPPSAVVKDVTFNDIKATTWISLTTLRRFGFDTVDRTDALTAMVLLALAGLRANEYNTHLRSGTDLVRKNQRIVVERHDQEPIILEVPSFEELAKALAPFAAQFGWTRTVVDVSGNTNVTKLVSDSRAAAAVTDEADEA